MDYTKCQWCGADLSDEEAPGLFIGYDIAWTQHDETGLIVDSAEESLLRGYLCRGCADIAAHGKEALDLLKESVGYIGDIAKWTMPELARLIKKLDPAWKASWEKED